jgi:hypothetical protein
MKSKGFPTIEELYHIKCLIIGIRPLARVSKLDKSSIVANFGMSWDEASQQYITTAEQAWDRLVGTFGEERVKAHGTSYGELAYRASEKL